MVPSFSFPVCVICWSVSKSFSYPRRLKPKAKTSNNLGSITGTQCSFSIKAQIGLFEYPDKSLNHYSHKIYNPITYIWRLRGCQNGGVQAIAFKLTEKLSNKIIYKQAEIALMIALLHKIFKYQYCMHHTDVLMF